MKTYENIEALQNDSIMVYTGMIVIYPRFRHESALDVDDAPKFNGCFAINNSTVAFVSNNVLYVTPYTQCAIQTLVNSGFQRCSFYVPFSNLDYPKEEYSKWKKLLNAAEDDLQKAFEKDCSDWCDHHGIGTIDKSVLDKCFVIPKEGIKVEHLYYENTYYPIITSKILDYIALANIGTYCNNNGKVVFVYRDGNTYVAKGYKIIRILKEAGYVKKGLFVPFSNGEIILDPSYRLKWEELGKI